MARAMIQLSEHQRLQLWWSWFCIWKADEMGPSIWISQNMDIPFKHVSSSWADIKYFSCYRACSISDSRGMIYVAIEIRKCDNYLSYNWRCSTASQTMMMTNDDRHITTASNKMTRMTTNYCDDGLSKGWWTMKDGRENGMQRRRDWINWRKTRPANKSLVYFLLYFLMITYHILHFFRSSCVQIWRQRQRCHSDDSPLGTTMTTIMNAASAEDDGTLNTFLCLIYLDLVSCRWGASLSTMYKPTASDAGI